MNLLGSTCTGASLHNSLSFIKPQVLDKLSSGGIGMNHTLEKNVLRFLLVFGILSFVHLIRKPPAKDWLLIFFFKGYISSILDKLLVRKEYIQYPVKLFKCFDISFVFDYLIFPITCVYYNQVTKTSSIGGILIKVLFFSIPMSITEHWFEKNTKLIKFKKGWNKTLSFLSINVTFLVVRAFIALVRKSDNTPVPENQ
jgi:hypothetical protein